MAHRLRRALAAVAASLALAAGAGSTASAAAPPDVRAPAAIVLDARSGAVLFAKDPDGRRAIASTTKLMTANLVLQRARDDQVFTAPPYGAQPAESVVGLRAGERMTVRDLLRALLLPSANDAAATLALGVAGSTGAFVDQMNAEARRLHLVNTGYANPVGLDDPANYSSARDLANLARRLMRDPRFARVVDMPRATLTSGARPRTVLNRNQLVRSYPFVDGVKTGHTRQAGYVLVGAARRGTSRVISVVLHEPSEAARDRESLALLRYGLDQFQEVRPLIARKTLALVPVNWFDGVHIRLRAERDLTLSVRRGASVRTHVRLPFPLHLTGPLPTGTAVGSVTVVVDGRRVARVPLVTDEPTPAASFVRKAAIYAGGNRWAVVFGLLGIVLLAVFRFGDPLVALVRGRGER
ncbi:MAG TPA: D-alanyl-D-alanine carboxypeptidase family protein [Thermoleophilaceae bacterium]